MDHEPKGTCLYASLSLEEEADTMLLVGVLVVKQKTIYSPNDTSLEAVDSC
jgi:hypothetical protein